MVYSDLLFFLGLLPCSVALSFLDRSAEYKNLILILTSVIFISWAKPVSVCTAVIAVILIYLLGLGIGFFSKRENKPASAVLLAVSLIVNAAVLLIFGHNYLFEGALQLDPKYAILPVAAAYFAVRGFSYCFDVYTGKCRAEKNIFCLLTYMISYHLMLAGPVVRYGDIEPAIRKRTVSGRDINDGLDLFITGLGKAVLIAPLFDRIRLAGLNAPDVTLFGSWLGMAAFFAQGYFTFTAAADMAAAFGRMNGFDYPKNYTEIRTDGLFRGLVKSYNTTLVGFYEEAFSAVPGKGAARGCICIMLCCIAAAAWYHISAAYLAVGAAVGLILILERYVWGEKLAKTPFFVKGIYLLILALVVFGGIYFDSFADYKLWLLSLVGKGNAYKLSHTLKYLVKNNIFLIAAAFIIVCRPLKELIFKGIDRYADSSDRAYGQIRITKTILRAAVFIMCVVTLALRTAGA